MVKIVRVFLALFATLWYTTSPINSNSTSQVWVTPISKMVVETPDYYKPLEFNSVKYTPADAECLAKNIYFEAGVESTAGKLAVANVTINRAANKNYPNTICGVVQEGIHYYNANKDEYYSRELLHNLAFFSKKYKDKENQRLIMLHMCSFSKGALGQGAC